MLSLQFIREHTDVVREALRKRHTEAPIDDILRLDEERRRVQHQADELKAKRNEAGRRIGAMKDHVERQRLIDEMRGMADQIDALDARLREIDTSLQTLLLQVPNLPLPEVPVGRDERENVIVRSEGIPRAFDFPPKPHWELAEQLGIIDFERGAKIAGSRFFVLRGVGARLERALISWMLDVHTREHGYTEVLPPFVVREEVLWGAGQLPKFADNLYHDVEDDLWLVPTAEVPLTYLHANEILEPGTLPLRYVAYTPCFRRERMSAGREVRGIKRLHQFDKVELYKYCEPEQSQAELERMLEDALDICRAFAIPWRVVQICTGDLGFSAAMTYDIEMWAPGVQEWLEVSSVSNCTDFQARRSNIRFRREPRGRVEYPHTLNGSGLALPRLLIAILENYQQADGTITIPAVLRPYLGDLDVIRSERC